MDKPPYITVEDYAKSVLDDAALRKIDIAALRKIDIAEVMLKMKQLSVTDINLKLAAAQEEVDRLRSLKMRLDRV